MKKKSHCMMTVFIDEIIHVFCSSCNIRPLAICCWSTLYMFVNSIHDKRLFHEEMLWNFTFLWTLAAPEKKTEYTKKSAHVNLNSSEFACQEASIFFFITLNPDISYHFEIRIFFSSSANRNALLADFMKENRVFTI